MPNIGINCSSKGLEIGERERERELYRSGMIVIPVASFAYTTGCLRHLWPPDGRGRSSLAICSSLCWLASYYVTRVAENAFVSANTERETPPLSHRLLERALDLSPTVGQVMQQPEQHIKTLGDGIRKGGKKGKYGKDFLFSHGGLMIPLQIRSSPIGIAMGILQSLSQNNG